MTAPITTPTIVRQVREGSLTAQIINFPGPDGREVRAFQVYRNYPNQATTLEHSEVWSTAAGVNAAWRKRGWAEVPGRKSVDQASRERFVDYLRNRLIPDLEEAGSESTAEDFETCCDIIEDLS